VNFRKLLRKFDRSESLERGSDKHVRYSAFSEEGKEAIRLYEKAVGIMKEKSAENQADPYGWLYQAGIHGTFWNTMNDLTSLAPERGYGSAKQLQSGDTLLNNCTHYSGLWNDVARAGQDGADQAISGDITTNFLPWHRLYLQSFESVIRQVLKDDGEVGADSWALPYWDYTVKGQDRIPEEFLDRNSSLWEKSRSLRMVDGATLSDLLQPTATLALGADLVGNEPESIYDFQKLGREKAQDQTLFGAFSTYAEQNPHNNMHDAVGGIADYQWQRDILWNYTTEYADQDGVTLWGRDSSEPDNGLQAARQDPRNAGVFGNNPTVGPGLIGFVPTAAREPLFWLHHAYIDKIWSEWNASGNAAYLYAENLDQSPWNYQFFTPAADGSAEKVTYSYWGSDSNNVIANVYNPDYSYDKLNGVAKSSNANPVLALLDQPRFRPTFDTTPIDKSVKDVAYQSIELGPNFPIKAKDVLRLREQGINLTMELSYSVPMSAAQNIAVLVGDGAFLETNRAQIQGLWKAWEPGQPDGSGQSFNDPAWGSIYDNRGGAFAPTNLSNFAVGTINLLPMSGGAPMAMDGHGMQERLTVDLSDSIYRQSEFNLISDKSNVAIMLAASDPASMENSQTLIKSAKVSLHHSLQPEGNKKDPLTGSDFDAAAYFAEHPDLLSNSKALRNPERYYNKMGKELGHDRPTFKNRAKALGKEYLAANPDLADQLGNSPYKAIRHYLHFGMKKGRSLTVASASSSVLLSSGLEHSLDGHSSLMTGQVCCDPAVQSLSF
jgi:hypothetical protein